MNFCLWLCGIEAEVLESVIAEYRNLHILHCIDKQEKPVVLQDVAALQRQLLAALGPYKIGVQQLELLQKCNLLVSGSLNNHHLVTCRNNKIVFPAGLCFKSFVREHGLKNQVVTLFLENNALFRVAILYLCDECGIKLY